MEQYQQTLKASRHAALATLVRVLGDFDLAEDSLQEASLRALVNWTENPIPENPVAWLVQTARNYAIDNMRHSKLIQQIKSEVETLSDDHWLPDDELMASVLHQHDDQLRLIFTCCHPGLAFEPQVALTLKTVGGLATEEIARSFLIPVSTLQRRLHRAKQKIRDQKIPYSVPADNQLEDRLDAVFRVIYLIYNQAYTALKGAELFSASLSNAAIYLARMLNRLIRDRPEVMGLLALLLFQHARANARVDQSGYPVPLDQQDRSRWNQSMIAEANILLQKSDRHWNPGPYQIQAAIAAVHCNAKVTEETNWQEIVDLYNLLEEYSPSPVVTLNKAVAIACLHGPQKGLALLDDLAGDSKMAGFQYFHSARAGLLEQLGELSSACQSFEQAIKLCQNDSERLYMERKIQQLSN